MTLPLAGFTTPLRRTRTLEPGTSVGTIVVDGAEPGNRPGNASPRSPRALWWGRPWRGRAWRVDETCGATVVPERCVWTRRLSNAPFDKFSVIRRAAAIEGDARSPRPPSEEGVQHELLTALRCEAEGG